MKTVTFTYKSQFEDDLPHDKMMECFLEVMGQNNYNEDHQFTIEGNQPEVDDERDLYE